MRILMVLVLRMVVILSFGRVRDLPEPSCFCACWRWFPHWPVPGGARAVVAESVARHEAVADPQSLPKQSLRSSDRMVAGVCVLLIARAGWRLQLLRSTVLPDSHQFRSTDRRI
jgi:hypothetical protein